MKVRNKLIHTHTLYNLSRYLFLNIEWSYNDSVEKNGITLPQLRVLWIIKLFPDISLGEIAKIGCWSSPTVTKMLKILLEKNLVSNDKFINKKLYKINITEYGEDLILKCKRRKGEDFAFFKLLSCVNKDKVDYINKVFKSISVNLNSTFIFDYIEKINEFGIKIDYTDFEKSEVTLLEKLIYFYILLRIFVLNIETTHRELLIPYGITYPQYRILWIIYCFPGTTSMDISKIAYLSPSTINVIVKNLYSKDLIYKEKSKLKNSLYLYLSESGENLLNAEFGMNQQSSLIYKNIDFLSTYDLAETNKLLYEMNISLKNNIVEEYIIRTTNEIEKRFKDAP